MMEANDVDDDGDIYIYIFPGRGKSGSHVEQFIQSAKGEVDTIVLSNYDIYKSKKADEHLTWVVAWEERGEIGFRNNLLTKERFN